MWNNCDHCNYINILIRSVSPHQTRANKPEWDDFHVVFSNYTASIVLMWQAVASEELDLPCCAALFLLPRVTLLPHTSSFLMEGLIAPGCFFFLLFFLQATLWWGKNKRDLNRIGKQLSSQAVVPVSQLLALPYSSQSLIVINLNQLKVVASCQLPPPLSLLDKHVHCWHARRGVEERSVANVVSSPSLLPRLLAIPTAIEIKLIFE